MRKGPIATQLYISCVGLRLTNVSSMEIQSVALNTCKFKGPVATNL